MPSIGAECMERVLESMPPFPEDKVSSKHSLSVFLSICLFVRRYTLFPFPYGLTLVVLPPRSVMLCDHSHHPTHHITSHHITSHHITSHHITSQESPLLELHKLKSHAEHETSDRAAWKISHAEKEAFANANANANADAGNGSSEAGSAVAGFEASSHSLKHPVAFGAPSGAALRGTASQQMDLLSLDDVSPGTGPLSASPSSSRDQMDKDMFEMGNVHVGPGTGRLQPGGTGMDASAALLLDTLGGVGGEGGGGGGPVTLPLTDVTVRSELTKRLYNAIVAPAGARALLYESKDVGVWTEVREIRVGASVLIRHTMLYIYYTYNIHIHICIYFRCSPLHNPVFRRLGTRLTKVV